MNDGPLFQALLVALVCVLLGSVDVAAQGPDVPEALIAAVRERPWDRGAVEAIAAHFDGVDKPRAELVRLQLARNLLEGYRDPKWNELQSQINKLLVEHGARWKQPVAAIASKSEIEIGLIDSVTVETATDETIAALTPYREIRELWLESAELTPKGYAAIAAMPYLDHLVIEDGVLDQASIGALEKLQPHTEFGYEGDEGTRKAVDMMNRKRIARFDALTPEEKYAAGERFVRVHDFRPAFGRPARFADLAQAGMEDHKMRFLSRLSSLEEIDITECDVTENGIAQLAGLSKLKRLSLFETKVRSIASLENLVNLRQLELTPEYDVTFSEAGVAVIENFRQLELLRLWDDDSVHDLTVRRIGKLTRLVDLDLSVEIKDPTCLAALSGLTELEGLRLHPSIPSAALEHFARLGKLELLDLSLEAGESESFRHLAGLVRLKQVEFKGQPVTDKAIGYLTGCKELRVLKVQETPVTKEGAERLAARLPHVTILTRHHVVKTPRAKQILRRRQFRDDISLLVPDEWSDDSRHEGALRFQEDGWDSIGSWSGPEVGPASLGIHLDPRFKTPAQAIEYFSDGRVREKTIVREDIVSLGGMADVASCIYRDENGQYLVAAAKTKDGVLVLSAEVWGNRFAEFEPMFLSVAKSVRIGGDPQQHAEETVELPTAGAK